MIKAVDAAGGQVLGWDAERGGQYTCPGCQEAVTAKKGAIVVHHFAHRPGSECGFGVGESLRHMQMKAQVGSLFSKSQVDYEVCFGKDRRADVVVGRVVIECQASAISVGEWEARTRFYNQEGYAVLWVWDMRRLVGNGSYSKACPNHQTLGEMRVPAEMRNCYEADRNCFYVMNDNGELRACHLNKAIRDNDYHDGTLRTWALKATFWVTVGPKNISAPLRGAAVTTRSGLRTVFITDSWFHDKEAA